LAYYCFCTQERLNNLRESQRSQKKLPKYDQHCLHLSKEEIQKNLDSKVPYTIRMVIPKNETVVFEDLIRGKIKFNTNDIDDQVLIKSNGIPTYHFAVVVDDHLMNITHVLRAEEWLSSTPKHVLLYKYFGWDMPKTAHLTVLLDPDHKGKMSKRHGSVHARVFLENGYLPEAVLNFLMLLGWNPGTEQEIFTLSDFVKQFSIEKLNKKAPAFDRKKLDYINGIYIRQKTDSELAALLKPFIPQASSEILMQIIPLIKERITTLKDAANLTKFLFEDVSYVKTLLLQKNISPELALDMLNKTKELILNLKTFDFLTLQTNLLDQIKSNNWNTGQFFMVFRVAICGSVSTPPVVDCLPIIGKEATLRKINLAIDLLN
jgi:glutamyl-tRNA synthetase